MGKPFVKFHHVTFKYESAIEPLFKNISFHVASGWSGVAGANGTGKTTLLKLATGSLDPDEGQVELPQNAIYCSQRTDDIPDKFNELTLTKSRSAWFIKSMLGIHQDWIERWTTLSHGERKRAQIGVALWLKPDLLALDEPTNHVDSEAREVITNALHAFRGIGLLVSHDRELLDSLCQQCLFIDPPEVITRPGGITEGMQIAKAEQHSLQKQYKLKKHVYKKLVREAVRRRELAKQAQRRRSKRYLTAKDHDAREKKDRARMTGKDGVGGKLHRQLQGRLKQTHKQVEMIRIKKEDTLGIWLPGSLSKRDFLLKLPADDLMLGNLKQLHHPELLIKPGDRIAVMGPNGSGKSTLIRLIVRSLNVPKEHVTYIPQEIDFHQSRNILSRALTLPKEKLGHLMTIVSRLGSRPQRLLSSAEPSPGETRKLLLAIGMTHSPHIIVMDEPTNHMDLPSIECLEQALLDCPCSLLLVSHDRQFIQKLTKTTWNITKDPCVEEAFVMRII